MKPLSVGICTEDPAVLSACREGLRELGEVREIARDSGQLERPLPLDLLVLDLGKGEAADVALFAGCRSANYELPIVVACVDRGADFAVELLQLGAEDFVLSPPAPGILRSRVRRLLTGTSMAAVDSPLLAPLVAGDDDDDRRRSYRAHVAADMDASIRLTLGGQEVRAAVMDLSLDSERSPGALRVRTSADQTAPSLWLLAGRTEHPGFLYLEDDYPVPVEVRMRATRFRYLLRHRRIDVVLQYRTDGGEGARRVGRFWIRCQRRDVDRVE